LLKRISLSSPHNPIEGSEAVPSEAPAIAPTGVQPLPLEPAFPSPEALFPRLLAPAENPPWSGLDVFILAAVTIFAIFLSMMGVSLVAHVYFERGVPWVDVARKPEIVVLSQVLGYLVVL
jgi:hypothetical protein